MFKIRKHALQGKEIPSDHKVIRDVKSWISSNGSSKLVSELDKNHLQNIINKIERGEFEDERKALLPVLKHELIYRINK